MKNPRPHWIHIPPHQLLAFIPHLHFILPLRINPATLTPHYRIPNIQLTALLTHLTQLLNTTPLTPTTPPPPPPHDPTPPTTSPDTPYHGPARLAHDIISHKVLKRDYTAFLHIHPTTSPDLLPTFSFRFPSHPQIGRAHV